ncbi:hypothetical protein MN116_004737 [Schistosoma mekongi]|uniref:Uncharacterized protein n=1 Tax=Schistosoma mekongi TaxID=38744 RepID=A0AAE2D4W7_SCHME|nr:hypothetical protein MN116_004737 [Schistosoma mekongi]
MEDQMIIIDPIYENLSQFRKDYDYDLNGNVISEYGLFFRNPFAYLNKIIEQHIIEFLCTSLLCFSIFLIVFFLFTIIKRLIHYIRLIKLLINEFNSVKLQLKIIKNENLHMNYNELYAKAIFTVLISYYELFEKTENKIIPEDLIEYEIIRFVLEAVWKDNINYQQLWLNFGYQLDSRHVLHSI